MDKMLFETIGDAFQYAKEKGQEILTVNELEGLACPNCKEYARPILLYADETEHHETFSTLLADGTAASWWDWLEIVECCGCGAIYSFYNGT